MDEAGIPYVAHSQQMGHEVPGMRGVYSHVTDRMLADIRDALEQRWIESLRARAALSPTSAVPVLNAALMALGVPPRPLSLGAFAPNLLPNSDT
ncbi:hypothetical protein ODJ79_03605 [Actinoplanes sp. KI2]|uniref:hypothetical protein n=1 Tax=Actinoplanes sp. KI2 TaxID=2983315 RepID=UPI0021D60C7F|nr:hypothetical protein [Actinoplanes sp. KI2]MCU7722790.1 hypothetical protein [Actinoplanes sp. KI2]